MMERSQLISLVSDALKATHPSLQLAMLFGSRATAQARPNSDVDLGVLAERALSPDVIADIAVAVSEHVDLEVDVVDLYDVPQPVTDYILRGIRLFGSDECFANIWTRHLIEKEDFGRLSDRAITGRVDAWTEMSL